MSSEAYPDKRDAERLVDRVRFPPERTEVVVTDQHFIVSSTSAVSEMNDAVGDADGQDEA